MNTPEDQTPAFIEYRNPDERSLPLRSALLLILAGIFAPLALAYGYGTQNEVQITAIVISVICLGIGLVYPFWGLVFFVGLIYIRPEDTMPALAGLHLTLIASIVTIFSVFLQKVMDKSPPVRTPLNGMLLLFAGMTIVSSVAGGEIRTAITDGSRLVVLVFMILNLVNTPKRYNHFLIAVLAFTVYLAGYSVFLFFGGAGLKRGDEFQSQGTGIFGDPNDLSATIVAGLALAFSMALRSKGAARGLLTALSVFLVYSIYLTNSRGGMLALMGMAGCFLFILWRPRWLAVAFAVIVGFAFIKFGPSRMSELDTGEESANSRFWFWSNGVQQLISHPVTGVGYGQFADANGGMTAHNSFVLCFAELGLPGYFFWIGCIYYCFVKPENRQESEATRKPPERGGHEIRAPDFSRKLTVGSKQAVEKPAGTFVGFITRTPEDLDRIGAQLSLAAFLMAAFFISRTYVPILYLLMSLPVIQQISTGKGRNDFRRSPQTLFQDLLKIAAISAVSIVAIYLIAIKLR